MEGIKVESMVEVKIIKTRGNVLLVPQKEIIHLITESGIKMR